MKLTKEMRKTLFSFNDQERKIFLSLSDNEKEYMLRLSKEERRQYFEILYTDNKSDSNNDNISPFKFDDNLFQKQNTSVNKNTSPFKFNNIFQKENTSVNKNAPPFKFNNIFQKENTSLNKNAPPFKFSKNIFQKENASLKQKNGTPLFTFADDLFEKGNSSLKFHEQMFDGEHEIWRSYLDNENYNDINVLMSDKKKEIKKLIKSMLEKKDSIKMLITLLVRFKKKHLKENEKSDGKNYDVWTTTRYVNSGEMMEIYIGNNIDKDIKLMTDGLKENLEKTNLPASGFKIDKILELDVDICKLHLTTGKSYVKLPDWIANKKAIINPKNVNDDECFKWAVIAALNHKEIGSNPQRISKLKKYVNKYNWEGLEFPLAIKDIDKFEKNNPDICASVFGYKNSGFYTIKRSKHYGREKRVLLFLYNGHYTAIKDFSRLLSSSNSKDGHKQHFCINCHNGYKSKKTRDKHFDYCVKNEAAKIDMPEMGSTVKFTKGNYQLNAPYAMYADYESILKAYDSCEGDPDNSYTRKINKHEASGFCVYSKFAHGDVDNPLKLYRGKDCVKKFCGYVVNEAKRLYNMFPNNKEMDELTDEEKKSYNKANVCYICGDKFTKWCDSKKNDASFKKEYAKYKKVRDHCHFTGKYRGAAHNNCNLMYRVPKFIPIVMHNLSGYDACLFIKELAEQNGGEDISVIAENYEKYKSFSINVVVGSYVNKKGEEVEKKIELRFIDSLKFMPSSLDQLSSNLSDEQCATLKKEYGDNFKLMRQKGEYPYEYMDSWKKFKETELPSKDKFYSKLNMTNISDEKYEHAKNVWDTLGIKNMGEYHDEYLKTDVLLLVDVFENFRNMSLEQYGLDPAYFYTAPGLSWQACLKCTGVELELLNDYDMLLMIEKGIRGGIVQAIMRYAKANNKYMRDKYDPTEESSYLQYLDANNLYGWAMSQYMPTGGFKWVDIDYKKEKNKSDPKVLAKYVSKKASEIDKGYILEVDIDYPKELHDKHNELPFLAESKEINGVNKLTPNLCNKKKYVVHIKELDQALKHGLILKKIRRVIQFDQSDWLAKYIDKNTELRAAAKNEFEKNFFKLMNNAFFGKTMENVRKHRDIRLVTSKEKFSKLTREPNFAGCKRFSENFAAVEMKKTSVKMNKPIYLGMSILSLSKTKMYEFHYDYMKPMYGDNLKLCYMDTDSFVYHIKTDDFYKDIASDVNNKFDTSCYSKDCGFPLETGVNKKVIGMMKDELGDNIMVEFVALRSKTYAYKDINNNEIKKCKGTKKCVTDKELCYDEYVNCLFSGKDVRKKQMTFKREYHTINTVETNKVALNSKDDKRVVCDNLVDTLARGHYKLAPST